MLKRYSTSISFIIILFSSTSVFSQFKYACEIPDAKENGYYHVLISPDVLARSSSDLSDIRIKDSEGKEVPYLLRTENPREEEVSFEYFDLDRNAFLAQDSSTHVIVKNTNQEEIGQFCITIQSADIQKYLTVKGSDDGKTWYIVKQTTDASPGIASDNTTEVLVVDFPKGKYRYYEIIISNSSHEPLRVLSVGKYKYSEILGKYTEIPITDFMQADSTNKKTYLHFPISNKTYVIDKIAFSNEYRSDYYRTGLIMQTHDEMSQSSIVNSFVLSSKSQNIIQVNNLVLDKNTLVEIDNKDNPPLKIKQITAYQLQRYMTLYLEKGRKYSLFCGDNKINSPQYDLVHFEESIPKNLSLLELGALSKLDVKQSEKPEVKQSFFEKQAFMWIAIFGVGILLVIMCYQIVRKK